MAGIEVKIEWSPEFKRNVEDVFGDGGKLQRYIDAMILEGMTPYLPFYTGELYRSGILNTRIGSGELVWKTPYARYLYHGLLMVDPETGSAFAQPGIRKELAEPERNLQFQRLQPKSGSHWCERWTADNLKLFEGKLQGEANELMREGR